MRSSYPTECRWPKGDRKPGRCLATFLGWVPDNWPDTGPGARTRKGADVRRVSL